MVAVMAITASGVVSLLLAAPGATPIVTTVAAGYFAFLAYRIATAPPLTENTEFGRQPSFAGGDFSRWSTRRLTPQWRPCSPALCWYPIASRSTRGESNRACRDHHRGQLGMANRRSGAHALLSRSSHKPGDQCDFCRSSHHVRRLGAIAMNLRLRRRPLPPPSRLAQTRRALSRGASGPANPLRLSNALHQVPGLRRGEKHAAQNRDRLHAPATPRKSERS